MFRLIVFCLMTGTTLMNPVQADDLDDGIGFDQAVEDDLTLDKNVRFIKRKAVSKAKKGDGQSSGCGTGNIVIGPGSKVREVINLSTNKGTVSVCE